MARIELSIEEDYGLTVCYRVVAEFAMKHARTDVPDSYQELKESIKYQAAIYTEGLGSEDILELAEYDPDLYEAEPSYLADMVKAWFFGEVVLTPIGLLYLNLYDNIVEELISSIVED